MNAFIGNLGISESKTLMHPSVFDAKTIELYVKYDIYNETFRKNTK